MHKQSKTRKQFTASHGQAGVLPPRGKRGSIMSNSRSWEDKHRKWISSLPSSFPQLGMLSLLARGMGYPLGQLG